MITYQPLRDTLAARGISIYRLHADRVIGKASTDVLRTDQGNVNTKTINAICNYLHCDITDVIGYIADQPQNNP